MPKQITPYFEKGRILKKEALDSLRDYPRDMTDVMYQEYGDGIICGFHISYEAERVVVGPGILKHRGRLILVKESTVLMVPGFHTSLYCCIQAGEEERGPDYSFEPYELILSDREEKLEGLYELGRFQLEKGAVLRTCEQYKNFPDGDTRVNTLNVIHKKCSGRSGPTLEPALLKWFGRDLLAMKRLEPMDYGFAMLCLNGLLVERNVIAAYLEAGLKRDFKDGENTELFWGLREIWNRTSGARGSVGGKGSFGAKRTVID